MKTKNRIIKILKKNGQLSVAEISEMLDISRQYAHRILNELEEKGEIKRIGSPPKVFYLINEETNKITVESISRENELFLNEHFILVDALGNLLQGLPAMQYWCSRQSLPIQKTIGEYVETRSKYLSFYNEENLIDGLQKLKCTSGMETIGVDGLYYMDFYAIERFGKTRLGTLMHYAKQGQNKNLMKMIVSEIKNSIQRTIEYLEVDSILYVPPTIKRQVQIMDFLSKNLKIDLPEVKVEKVKSSIVVPQKALSRIFERVANAKNTFHVSFQPKHEHILIIDDAIGSGATINEIAIKLKEKKIAKKITGLAITGSYKEFEVISEL